MSIFCRPGNNAAQTTQVTGRSLPRCARILSAQQVVTGSQLFHDLPSQGWFSGLPGTEKKYKPVVSGDFLRNGILQGSPNMVHSTGRMTSPLDRPDEDDVVETAALDPVRKRLDCLAIEHHVLDNALEFR